MFTAQINFGSATWGNMGLGNWSLGEITLHFHSKSKIKTVPSHRWIACM